MDIPVKFNQSVQKCRKQLCNAIRNQDAFGGSSS